MRCWLESAYVSSVIANPGSMASAGEILLMRTVVITDHKLRYNYAPSTAVGQ